MNIQRKQSTCYISCIRMMHKVCLPEKAYKNNDTFIVYKRDRVFSIIKNGIYVFFIFATFINCELLLLSFVYWKGSNKLI
jgi:hypothetical protein